MKIPNGSHMKFFLKVFVLVGLIVIGRLDRERWVVSEQPVKPSAYPVYSFYPANLKNIPKPVYRGTPQVFLTRNYLSY